VPQIVRLTRDAVALALSEAMAVAIPRLSPGARMRAGRAVGRISVLLQRGSRQLVAEELERCCGSAVAQDRDVLRHAFSNIWLDGVEPHLFPGLSADNIDGFVRLEGEEHLQAGLARGKGVLLFIGHFGLNTLTMAALGHRGYVINQLSAPPPVWREILGPENINSFAYRRALHAWNNEQTLPAQHISVFSFLRPAFKALRRNEILCIAVDGGGGKGWVPVRFMGRPATISSGPAKIALRTGAAVIPAVVLRGDDGRHTVILEPELTVERSGDADEDERLLTQRFMDLLERWVQRYPDHYASFLRLRRRAAATDTQPLFRDYNEHP